MHKNPLYDPQYFRAFPEYEDVFYDDIENHKKHFLPICSVNLKFLYPERDEWCHFISCKEIYEGCVGQYTHQYHTRFCQEDMLGFDMIDGKYKFEGSWDYFYINQKDKSSIKNLSMSDDIGGNPNECFEYLEDCYQLNHDGFNLIKAFYNKHNRLFYGSSLFYMFDEDEIMSLKKLEKKLKVIEKEWQEFYTQHPNIKQKQPEYFGFLTDIKFQSQQYQSFIKDNNLSHKDMNYFERGNLLNIPKDDSGHIFEYIGTLSGEFFQYCGANVLYLFHHQDLQKAVICFEYD